MRAVVSLGIKKWIIKTLCFLQTADDSCRFIFPLHKFLCKNWFKPSTWDVLVRDSDQSITLAQTYLLAISVQGLNFGSLLFQHFSRISMKGCRAVWLSQPDPIKRFATWVKSGSPSFWRRVLQTLTPLQLQFFRFRFFISSTDGREWMAEMLEAEIQYGHQLGRSSGCNCGTSWYL